MMLSGSGLYLTDSYVQMCDAAITYVDGQRFMLDTTVFCPGESGQMPDRGSLSWRGGSVAIVQSQIEDGQIVHYTSDALPRIGTRVECSLDWNYRYRMMRTHTAMHLVSALARYYGGGIRLRAHPTQNGITVQYAFSFWNKCLLSSIERRANEAISADLPVYTYPLTRAEVMASPLLHPLILEKLPRTCKRVRVVEIEGIALDLDMGNHVRSTREIGSLTMSAARQITRDRIECDIILHPAVPQRPDIFAEMLPPSARYVKGKPSTSQLLHKKEFYL